MMKRLLQTNNEIQPVIRYMLNSLLVLSCINVFMITSTWGQKRTAHTDIDKQFNAILREVAERRVKTKQVDIKFSHLFEPLIKQYSLDELCDYLNNRFKLERFRDGKGNIAFTSREGRELRRLEIRFIGNERLHLGCSYSADWKSATEVIARVFYLPIEF